MKLLKVYNLGEKGVNVDASDIHGAEGELRESKNIIRNVTGALGGVTNRQGLFHFNGLAAAGPILGGVSVPFPDERDTEETFTGRRMYLGFTGFIPPPAPPPVPLLPGDQGVWELRTRYVQTSGNFTLPVNPTTLNGYWNTTAVDGSRVLSGSPDFGALSPVHTITAPFVTTHLMLWGVLGGQSVALADAKAYTLADFPPGFALTSCNSATGADGTGMPLRLFNSTFTLTGGGQSWSIAALGLDGSTPDDIPAISTLFAPSIVFNASFTLISFADVPLQVITDYQEAGTNPTALTGGWEVT